MKVNIQQLCYFMVGLLVFHDLNQVSMLYSSWNHFMISSQKENCAMVKFTVLLLIFCSHERQRKVGKGATGAVSSSESRTLSLVLEQRPFRRGFSCYRPSNLVEDDFRVPRVAAAC